MEVDPNEVRAVVQRARSLAQTREEIRALAWNQAAADRIVQELVLEDEWTVREDFAAQMPLIEPREESNLVYPEYASDLGPVGEHRDIVRDSSNTDTVDVVQQKYEFVGLDGDGTVVSHWGYMDFITLPEDEWQALESVITSFPEEPNC